MIRESGRRCHFCGEREPVCYLVEFSDKSGRLKCYDADKCLARMALR